ncbi:Cof-type HAD-IIB family hydrolase [Neobacillus niacini]|uniref:Cof-type HAD-IIB family hydrolase n=1 Tax=Neobacillus niacini TaxID=86668 RepID=UPI0028546CB5|nr:Cof-type HAD-IIB family hydrolase [Neobacillus niacini]MDR7002664.1 Cof subfamily protein (haloacid dehalogenase superfamily) [Neobacillus niacini]
MANIKVVFSDIDGTLLNSNHQITSCTKQTIQKVVQKEIEFILISARMPSGMKAIYHDLDIKSPLICYNGALILENPKVNENNKILYSATISNMDANKIYDIIKRNFSNVSFNLFIYDQWLVENKADKWTKQESDIIQVQPMAVDVKKHIAQNEAVHKILCMGDPHLISELEAELNDTLLNVCCYRSKNTYLEITSNDASKVLAIKALESYFAVKREEVMAIGDNFNDMAMIEYAGIGIAMGNAPQQVKDASDFVTKSNDQDGMKWALETFIQS